MRANFSLCYTTCLISFFTNLAEYDYVKDETVRQGTKLQSDDLHKSQKQKCKESASQKLDASKGGLAEDSDDGSNQSVIDSEEEEYLCSEQGAGMTDELPAEKSGVPISKDVLVVREKEPIEEKQNVEEHAVREQIVEEQFKLISGSAENSSGAYISPEGKV